MWIPIWKKFTNECCCKFQGKQNSWLRSLSSERKKWYLKRCLKMTNCHIYTKNTACLIYLQPRLTISRMEKLCPFYLVRFHTQCEISSWQRKKCECSIIVFSLEKVIYFSRRPRVLMLPMNKRTSKEKRQFVDTQM